MARRNTREPERSAPAPEPEQKVDSELAVSQEIDIVDEAETPETPVTPVEPDESTNPEPEPQAEGPATREEPVLRQRFRVMRRLAISATEHAEVGTIIEETPAWPYRRAKQFVELGYLAPIVTEEA